MGVSLKPSTRLTEWQRSVIEDPLLPAWYKGALFNETYYVSDGGTVWIDGEGADMQPMPVADWPDRY
jgi:non-lysosomal glucosylceramidase